MVGFEESIKDPQKFIDTLKQTVLDQAKIEPNKKVSELEASLETLRNTVTQKETAYTELQKEVSNVKTRSTLLGAIPKLADIGLKNEDVLDLFLKTYEVRDGVVYKDDKPIQDDMASNLGVDKVLSSFVSDRGWDYVEGSGPKGRGRNQNPNPNPGGASASFEDYEKEMNEKGLHPGSQEAQALLKTYVDNNPEILN